MRKFLSLVAAGALAVALAVPAAAQDAAPFIVMSSVELAPEDAEVFAGHVQTVANAARDVGLAEEQAWSVYRWDNTFTFIGEESTLANMEDPEAFARAWQGTGAEEEVMAVFEATGALRVLSSSMQVMRPRQDLTYIPAQPAMMPGEQGGVYLMEQWPKGDTRPQFEESVKDIMGMLTEMGAPYPVLIGEDIIGDGGVSFAVIFDNLSNFYGQNSLEAGLADSGMAEAWMSHVADHATLISRSTSQIMMYLPDLSYQPEESM